jgi:hypothetical protein
LKSQAGKSPLSFGSDFFGRALAGLSDSIFVVFYFESTARLFARHKVRHGALEISPDIAISSPFAALTDTAIAFLRTSTERCGHEQTFGISGRRSISGCRQGDRSKNKRPQHAFTFL